MLQSQDSSSIQSSQITYSSKLLSVLIYAGLIGAVMLLLPLLVEIEDLAGETISDIGNFITDVIEFVFISLIAYKINKEGIPKPSSTLLMFYLGIYALTMIVELISEDMGEVLSYIDIVMGIVIGFVFMLSPNTKKIGIWFFLSIAGLIIVMAVVSNDGIDYQHKGILKLLLALYILPYCKYLEECKKFLTNKNE